MRWRPVGVPYFPKIQHMTDLWPVTHEEVVFSPDVDGFVLERWLPIDLAWRELEDLPTCGVGDGRRTCPGRHFAGQTVWIVIARLL